MLIDTHAHLTDDKFRDELPDVVARADGVGVSLIIDVGENVETSRRCVGHARRFDGVYASVGIHPHHALRADEEAFSCIHSLADDLRVVAIGETGLDFYRDLSPRAGQEACFRRQLGIADVAGLPIIMHCRDAYGSLVSILGERGLSGAGGVVHCFSGNRADAGAILEMGYHISVGGPLTYPKNDELRETVRSLPLERLLIETDCPYLAPQPRRGKRNEPAYIAYVADEIARIRGLERDEIDRLTTGNARRLFNRIA